MSRPRVVIAGLGDIGVLTAIHLARHVDVVGISSKPEVVSGQEVGVRLARPDDWAADNRVAFSRYRRLEGVRRVHGSLTGLDPDAREVGVRLADGSESVEPYDVLVVSTGVTNGFWRTSALLTSEQVDEQVRTHHERVAAAGSVAVIGGGAAALSVAANLRIRWPDQRVDLYFPGERALAAHHPRAWAEVRRRLVDLGVGLHPGHRAVVPDGFAGEAITDAPVAWQGGQPPTVAEAVVWAIGRVRPNTEWLPAYLLDERGFVAVTPTLQSERHPEIFAVGDVAATDPQRSSARNRADRLLAANIRAHLAGRPLAPYRATRSRWGSVLGVQDDGLLFLTADGRAIQLPRWLIERVLLPWVVRRGFYGGVRRKPSA
ncbi:FAD-dependent oxidoreductase [Nocardioides lianchengensis]|uniref:NADH dehydrogenase, FAD-containing subunit n=1 Tax=Nocardioides lianchengensis TaxID=1045774 RepID=A0A1G6WAA8_9ACTN|nr:FAD-dependent oxidoreductase [Nocardioides lianchengensis]NYG09386.1 NADH dehydrogenase FAD-containing subunit [Nocardioides lianchengensis]SDD62729.1 NADH dehydrogenase, FAD-containing subunit [Nocardioides lianchengensis]